MSNNDLYCEVCKTQHHPVCCPKILADAFEVWINDHIPEYDDQEFVSGMYDIAKVAWDAACLYTEKNEREEKLKNKKKLKAAVKMLSGSNVYSKFWEKVCNSCGMKEECDQDASNPLLDCEDTVNKYLEENYEEWCRNQ